MGQPLQLLKRNRAGPQKCDAAPIGTQCPLRQITGFGRPFGVVDGGVIPVHQNGAVSGITVKPDESGRIGLFIDQRQLRPHAQKPLINFVADAQIGFADARRHQRADDLRIAGADEFDPARSDQGFRFGDPRGIARGDFFQRVAG